jgi:hypothetical protein
MVASSTSLIYPHLASHVAPRESLIYVHMWIKEKGDREKNRKEKKEKEKPSLPLTAPPLAHNPSPLCARAPPRPWPITTRDARPHQRSLSYWPLSPTSQCHVPAPARPLSLSLPSGPQLSAPSRSPAHGIGVITVGLCPSLAPAITSAPVKFGTV